MHLGGLEISHSSATERAGCATQGGHEAEERHLRQLMELMHHEESCSDEEGEGHARLLALAAQVATQRGPTQPVSQAVRLSCPQAGPGHT